MTYCFFFNKEKIKIINNKSNVFFDYKKYVELPIENHPGSFGFIRKNHIHEGLDFYCEKNEPVYSIEEGIIKKIKIFTGEKVFSPWWNETYCVLIEYKNFIINYGEIIPINNLKEGMLIKKGELIGKVERVLKKDKGRPMDMLHLEMYEKGVSDSIEIWSLNKEKPNKLINPTNFMRENFFI